MRKIALLDYFLARGSLIDESQFAELKLSAVAASLEELKKTVPWPTRAPTIRQERHSRAVHLHTRGDFRVPADVVQAGLPAWLKVGSDISSEVVGKKSAAVDESAMTRLDLARWIVSPINPLTARVVVNRMWQEFFGRGLVDPPDDFGLRGQPPSHPQLLDWLADEFMERGWSVKQMHRLIVTSATYRQSSAMRPELLAIDPLNRLVGRQMPLRFSADQVRDAALSVSGLLERRIGGPSVFPPQPDVVSKEGFSNVWKASEGPDRYRRGLYTWTQRLSPFAQNVTFDAPPPSISCTRRDRSNSPLQALTLLNDPVFFEAAQAMARASMLAVPANDQTANDQTANDEAAGDRNRLQWLMLQAVSRPADERELKILTEYLNDQRQLVSSSPDVALRLAPVSVEGVDTEELAAWTGVCSIVLNLHEFLTRE